MIGLGHHSETMEELIIYEAMYDSPDFGLNAIWARPRGMFFEEVEFNGRKVPRFKYIEPARNK